MTARPAGAVSWGAACGVAWGAAWGAACGAAWALPGALPGALLAALLAASLLELLGASLGAPPLEPLRRPYVWSFYRARQSSRIMAPLQPLGASTAPHISQLAISAISDGEP